MLSNDEEMFNPFKRAAFPSRRSLSSVRWPPDKRGEMMADQFRKPFEPENSLNSNVG